MSPHWADKVARQLLNEGLLQTGTCLILGAADTGKTTLAAALANCAASSGRVGIIDADIGQSHIGPPTTVGWALIDKQGLDFSQLTVGGISFVGDVTPAGHLLQITAAIAQCVQQVSKVAERIIVDTPGFIFGPAAAALWWTVQRILQPKTILAVQRGEELSDILTGLRNLDLKLEIIRTDPQIPLKSPQERRSHRHREFSRYFRNSRLYNIRLSDVTVQPSRKLGSERVVNHVGALRNGKGTDIAVGLITDLQEDKDIVVVRTVLLDIRQIRCLVIGDATVNIAEQ